MKVFPGVGSVVAGWPVRMKDRREHSGYTGGVRPAHEETGPVVTHMASPNPEREALDVLIDPIWERGRGTCRDIRTDDKRP
jgi:hypothetical protein